MRSLKRGAQRLGSTIPLLAALALPARVIRSQAHAGPGPSGRDFVTAIDCAPCLLRPYRKGGAYSVVTQFSPTTLPDGRRIMTGVHLVGRGATMWLPLPVHDTIGTDQAMFLAFDRLGSERHLVLTYTPFVGTRNARTHYWHIPKTGEQVQFLGVFPPLVTTSRGGICSEEGDGADGASFRTTQYAWRNGRVRPILQVEQERSGDSAIVRVTRRWTANGKLADSTRRVRRIIGSHPSVVRPTLCAGTVER
ncbi:MAG: hypothetical protein MUF00_21180 [Gemmatimonadaceae bacterium]|jgi:hypothetical protein|nr:hypothetical protein [Gemmatimonadaceae bacterium]